VFRDPIPPGSLKRWTAECRCNPKNGQSASEGLRRAGVLQYGVEISLNPADLFPQFAAGWITARQAAKALNIRRGAGFQPARGLLHGRRSSRNRCGQKTNQPLVAQPLVVPFETAMGKEFVDRLPQGAFSERDHPVQAGFLDGSDKAFRVGIQIRRTGRPPQPARPNAGTETPSRWSSGCTLARFQAVFLRFSVAMRTTFCRAAKRRRWKPDVLSRPRGWRLPKTEV